MPLGSLPYTPTIVLQLAALYIYPIKSMGGVCLRQAIVEERGFRYDRRFMLVTPDGRCLTQHRNHQMALLDVAIENECHLRVWHRHRPADVLELPLTIEPAPDAPTVPVCIWDSASVAAVPVSPAADRWFSRTLNESCSLVFMPSTTRRAVDPRYARHQENVSFADGYPFLLIGQASLDDLSRRSGQALEMRRFRPNIVVNGGAPYEEETWERFRIGRQVFYAGESCGRCILTTLDPLTACRGPEPLRTLATYRHWDNKLVFGQYMLAETWQSAGVIEPDSNLSTLHVGQFIDVLSRQLVANEPYG